MKKLVFSFLCIIALALSCSKNQDDAISYGDDKLNIKIRNSSWYTTLDSNNKGAMFGEAHLKISGSTNGDDLYIRTNGDGKISFSEMNLNDKNEFSDDIVIAFVVTSMPLKDKEYSTNTTLLAIKNNDTLKVDLESGKLKF